MNSSSLTPAQYIQRWHQANEVPKISDLHERILKTYSQLADTASMWRDQCDKDPNNLDFKANLDRAEQANAEQLRIITEVSHILNTISFHTERDTDPDLLKEYLKITSGVEDHNSNRVSLSSWYECEKCGFMLVETKNSEMACPSCCVVSPAAPDNSLRGMTYTERQAVYIKSNIKYQYNPVTHFRERLNQLQAKEYVALDESVIDTICQYLHKHRIDNLDDMTVLQMRHILKACKLSQYYKHTIWFISHLSNRPPKVQLDRHVENTLLQMFEHIIPYYKTLKRQKSMFNYNYTICKLLEIIGHYEEAKTVRLLDDLNKLYVYDNVWKELMQQVQWPFWRTVGF